MQSNRGQVVALIAVGFNGLAAEVYLPLLLLYAGLPFLYLILLYSEITWMFFIHKLFKLTLSNI